MKKKIREHDLESAGWVLSPPKVFKKSAEGERECESYPASSPTDNRILSLNKKIDTLSDGIRWSWACRILGNVNDYRVNTSSASQPKVGDLALVKIEEIGNHSKIMTINNKRLRIYVGDLFVGVFGNRYATKAFEGVVDGLDNLSMLTACGMIGTVKSKHGAIKNPTRVSFVGFMSNGEGQKINLKELKFHESVPKSKIKNLIVIVGTKMDSGKTTCSTKLIKGFSEKWVRVAACKLTGSVSHRDQDEMRSAAATFTTDFSDYGFPSTYLCPKQELIDLFFTMLSNVEKMNVDVTIMEIADGILQRETAMLLEDPSIKQMIKGIVLTAECAPSALYGVEKLKKLNYNVIAVSGTMTSSPLSVREFREHSEISVGSSKGSGKELVNIVKSFIDKER